MWVFITLLCLVGLAFSIVRVSLPERTFASMLVAWLPAGLGIAAVPWATQVNLQTLTTWLNRFEVLQDFCVVLIVESILAFLVFGLLMGRPRPGVRAVARGFAAIPAFGGLVGVFLLLVLVFNTTTGWSFATLGIGFGALVGLAVSVGAWLLRRALRERTARLEVLVVLAFVQLVFAMFLPLVAAGVSVPSRGSELPPVALPLGLALALGCALAAFVVRRTLNRIGGAPWTR